MDLRITTTEELEQAARACVDTLPKTDHATVVTLSGELGAGKTAFVQAAARYCGVEERVTSPTFVIERIYRVNFKRFSALVHIDAFRLASSHELLTLGWRDLVQEPANLIFLEWPERVFDLIPPDARRISIALEGDTRTISYDR